MSAAVNELVEYIKGRLNKANKTGQVNLVPDGTIIHTQYGAIACVGGNGEWEFSLYHGGKNQDENAKKAAAKIFANAYRIKAQLDAYDRELKTMLESIEADCMSALDILRS